MLNGPASATCAGNHTSSYFCAQTAQGLAILCQSTWWRQNITCHATSITTTKMAPANTPLPYCSTFLTAHLKIIQRFTRWRFHHTRHLTAPLFLALTCQLTQWWCLHFQCPEILPAATSAIICASTRWCLLTPTNNATSSCAFNVVLSKPTTNILIVGYCLCKKTNCACL